MADKQSKLCVYKIHLGNASSIDEDHQSWGFSPPHTVIFHASEGSNPIPHIQCGLIIKSLPWTNSWHNRASFAHAVTNWHDPTQLSYPTDTTTFLRNRICLCPSTRVVCYLWWHIQIQKPKLYTNMKNTCNIFIQFSKQAISTNHIFLPHGFPAPH